MRDIFDQDRPMTLGAVKLATAILGFGLVGSGVLVLLSSLLTLLNGHPLMALAGLVIGLSALAFLFIAVRLLGEILAALHRLNDRITILGDDIRNPRRVYASPAETAGD